MPEVIPIKLAYSRVYLVKENGKNLIIDAGLPGKSDLLIKKIRENGVEPEDIELIVITHVHYDHVGNLARLKEVTNAPVLVSSLESEMLAQGKSLTPSGTNVIAKLISGIGRKYNPLSPYKAVKPDVLFSDFGTLKEFGFSASLISTPGHTPGSISVVFGSGEAFVGDTCFRVFNRKSVFPVFANDIPTLLKSWRTLLESEARIFYPGHGNAFGKDLLLQSYEKLSLKYR
jgi:glyoxylase-like metal-dependent hydrolase (beta-lactamase superfamily II)